MKKLLLTTALFASLISLASANQIDGDAVSMGHDWPYADDIIANSNDDASTNDTESVSLGHDWPYGEQ